MMMKDGNWFLTIYIHLRHHSDAQMQRPTCEYFASALTKGIHLWSTRDRQ